MDDGVLTAILYRFKGAMSNGYNFFGVASGQHYLLDFGWGFDCDLIFVVLQKSGLVMLILRGIFSIIWTLF